MTIKTLDGGRYKVDVRPRGRDGRRIQKIFKKKADAVAYERYVLGNMHDKEWLEKPADQRRLSELMELWWQMEGRSLKYAEKRKAALLGTIRSMDDPRASHLNQRFMKEWRTQRLHDGNKASTINRDETVMSSMFRVLIDAGEYHGDNPIRLLPALKEKIAEMAYLTNEEIARLLDATEGDARRLTILCLSTGARWGEATSLKAENIQYNRATFTETKNGKVRTVPLSDEVVHAIKIKASGILFNVSYSEYRRTLREVKPDLPKGQAAHVLRHTFAAHFMINGGNILTLQKIMGHANIQQTMTYAHLAPDYLQDAIALNPLKGNIHIPSTPTGS
ncbi:MAG: integrase [Candidatus Symbiopectobacterium sp. Dall1.0]|nr:integrase [Candidatus Symbiopectobacterium sp. Dall1.0]